MATTINRRVTFAEFEQLSGSHDGRFELRHGEPVKVPPPKLPHARIQHRLRRMLESVVRDSGEIITEWGFRPVPANEYRVGDIVFISRERWDRLPADGYFEGAPDIVIEILSPSNTAVEMLDKEQICLENGAREFWIVDANRRQVRISTPDGRAATCKSGRQIPLLFGGSIPLDAIFRDEN